MSTKESATLDLALYAVNTQIDCSDPSDHAIADILGQLIRVAQSLDARLSALEASSDPLGEALNSGDGAYRP